MSAPRRPNRDAAAAGLLVAESRLLRHAIQAVALLAVLASLVYLTWRAGFTMGPDLWLAVPLLALEAHAVASLALYVFSLWNVDSVAPPQPVHDTGMRVAVLIPTYNEGREVILPTIAAAVALRPAHETWVLDDGDRPWVRSLVEGLGAHYLARPEHRHAKAGNLNYALGRLDADVIAVLDADHVPTGGFLSHTLGYFADPTVAVVQTPQDFYNVDSFEHGANRSRFWWHRQAAGFNEQRLFYRAIQPGKNRWNAAFWCGTSALVRVAALRDVGGVATETINEDIHTTVRMHRRGWRSVFHNEVLAYGLAAGDAEQYQSQRLRWGTGAMQLLRAERPLTGPGLTLAQRLAYAATLLGWFDAWRTLGYVLVPIAVLLSGATPIAADGPTFVAVFGGVFLVQRLALGLLGRGFAPQVMAILFEFIRMPSNLRATLTLFRRGERRFAVTGKGGSAQRRRVTAPALLRGLVLVSALALAWGTLSLAGFTPTTYRAPWIAYGAIAWGVVNGVFLLAAMRRIESDRFAADRRTGVRLRLDAGALVNEHPAYLVDISVGGALVRVQTGTEVATAPCRLRFTIAGADFDLVGEERNRLADAAGGALLALQFSPGEDVRSGHLIGALLGRHDDLAQVPALSGLPGRNA